jgi:predicted nuclease of restriction endonuclease-like (RecB) superfamily
MRNLQNLRAFYSVWPIRQIPSAESAAPNIRQIPSAESAAPNIRQIPSAESSINISHNASGQISETVSRKSSGNIRQTTSGKSDVPILQTPSAQFPLPWSHYVRLLSVENPSAREFYETEALRGGWTVKQLARQINTSFYERTALSRNKAAMLTRHNRRKPEDVVTAEEEIKDPFLLEFLGLKDEYSETQLEEALILKLETFLLELGNDFTFIGRQRRLRVGDSWYRIDLLLFHRRLRCLVIIDLKTGEFTHAEDAPLLQLCKGALDTFG